MTGFRLRPGFPVLVYPDGTVQVGTDPNFRALFKDFSPAQRGFLRLLSQNPTAAQLSEYRVRADLDPAAEKELEARLKAHNLLYYPPRHLTGRVGTEKALCLRLDGSSLAYSWRQDWGVRVFGAGRVGALIAVALRSAGFARVQLLALKEAAQIEMADLFPYPSAALGQSRRDAINDLLDFGGKRAQPLQSIDLDIFVTDGAFASELAQLFHSEVYLPVVVNEMGISVGPVISPLRAPCQSCVSTDITKDQPFWLEQTQQLHTRRSHRDSFSPAVSPALTAAGLAVNLAADYLDRRDLNPPGACYYVPAYSAGVQEKIVQARPRCTCAAQEIPSESRDDQLRPAIAK